MAFRARADSGGGALLKAAAKGTLRKNQAEEWVNSYAKARKQAFTNVMIYCG